MPAYRYMPAYRQGWGGPARSLQCVWMMKASSKASGKASGKADCSVFATGRAGADRLAHCSVDDES
jgi:hypothetical protein